jgi:hypothetical protein
MVVTGRVEFYGVAPTSKQTRLTSNANVGDTVINVADATDWKVGDEIVLGPTNVNPHEAEKVKITAIAGNAVTIDKALAYFHYGNNKITISNANAGEVNINSSYG